MKREQEQGFVLVTSLVLLLILTILGVGLYFRSTVNQQSSASVRDSTQAYYFAETALNYLSWNLHSGQNNDEELDGNNPANPGSGGDRSELQAVIGDPYAQVLYIDNRTIASRWVAFDPANPTSAKSSPTMSTLSLPGHYLSLAINPAGVITKTLDAVPTFGAVVWMSPVEDGSVSTPSGADIQVVAERDYDLAAYAIGYVNGKPLRVLRAIVGHAGVGPPVGLGSVTNGYQP